MQFPSRLFCAVSLCQLIMASTGFAQESAGEITRGAFPAGEERCYVQQYGGNDAPKKASQLTEILLYRLLRPHPAYEVLEQDRDTLIAFDREYTTQAQLSMIARFNDTPGAFTQGVSCNDSEGRMSCWVDCDGGGFQASTEGGSLSLDFREGGMVVRGGCGDDGEVLRRLDNSALPGPSLLQPRPLETCVNAERRATRSFAREFISLRERISTLGWNCLKRSYSKAHFRKNPKQNVRSIAVSLALVIKDSDEIGKDVTLEATASIVTRDGKKAKRTYSCYPSQYDFTCGEDFRLKRRDATSALLLQGSYPLGPDESRQMLGLALGSGDDTFRLYASKSKICEAE